MIKNESAFEKLLEQNYGIIRKISNLYGQSPDDKADLSQEISIQLWHAFPKFDENQKFSTWMYRIALNVAISHYRKNRTKGNFFTQYDENLHNIPASGEENRENKLALLEKFISELKELDKALMLLYLEKKKHEEIADILGISVSNAGTKIGRIKQLLKQKFDSYKGE
ncbi:MAG: sigma-70 family RNA polymerase sigma factor [Bacteroidetes bacterium]|nr:sigma-70 family RNA polymerase sigma factor [Bacteroidota bacterium]